MRKFIITPYIAEMFTFKLFYNPVILRKLMIQMIQLSTINKLLLFAVITLSSLAIPNRAVAASDTVRYNNNDLIPVFLDFSFHQNYIRENITFVNYVRDRELSKVHIMLTSHPSGSSGRNYVLSFIGRRSFAGMNNKITYWAPGTNSSDDTRKGLVKIIKMGLLPYLANTEMADQVSIKINGGLQLERGPLEDPWKNWILEVHGGGNFHKESSQDRYNARWGFSANKISEEWKIRVSPYFNYNERNFFDTDEGTITSKSHRHGFLGDFVKSIDQHWSAGLFVRILSSTFHNANFNTSVSPGIEYSLFPYSEATRKAITMVYRLGLSHNNYLETTIFQKDQETLGSHSLNVSTSYRQPWGSYRASITGSHFFHDYRANRVSFSTHLNLRILKGLSLSLSSNFNLINDLVSLPAGDETLEEILLQQRRQATDYQLSGSFGLAYTFGSQFNNVVNTRF